MASKDRAEEATTNWHLNHHLQAIIMLNSSAVQNFAEAFASKSLLKEILPRPNKSNTDPPTYPAPNTYYLPYTSKITYTKFPMAKSIYRLYPFYKNSCVFSLSPLLFEIQFLLAFAFNIAVVCNLAALPTAIVVLFKQSRVVAKSFLVILVRF